VTCPWSPWASPEAGTATWVSAMSVNERSLLGSTDLSRDFPFPTGTI
jgi:hypothetical protein